MAEAFRHLPVHSLEDVTHNFEQIESERATELQGTTSGGGAGAWTETTLSTKVEAGSQTPRVRTEGTIGRLRGVVKTKAGQEVKAGETILTVPVGFRPPAAVAMVGTFGAGGIIRYEITSAGVMSGPSENIGAERNIYLDNLTWNLT